MTTARLCVVPEGSQGFLAVNYFMPPGGVGTRGFELYQRYIAVRRLFDRHRYVQRLQCAGTRNLDDPMRRRTEIDFESHRDRRCAVLDPPLRRCEKSPLRHELRVPTPDHALHDLRRHHEPALVPVRLKPRISEETHEAKRDLNDGSIRRSGGARSLLWQLQERRWQWRRPERRRRRLER